MKKEADVKYIPLVLSDYMPVIGNYNKIKSSKYLSVQILPEHWTMYSLKLTNID